MATIIHLGNVGASATGHGGLGVVRLGPTYNPALGPPIVLPDELVVTNLPERGALYTREKAQLTDGIPNQIAPMACHTLSLVNIDTHLEDHSLNPRSLDVNIGADQRWVAGSGHYTVTGPDAHGNYVTTWASAVGAGGQLQFAVQTGEHDANPATGILVDPTNKYWSRIGQVNYTAVVDDQNPGLLTPGPSPITKLTALLVATPYETDWYFGDLMAFYDPGQIDPVAAKLACIRMESDELQLWIRGQMYTERVVNPWVQSPDMGQQLDGRRPIIVGWSIDTSVLSDTAQTGKGSLVVIDPHSSLAIDYTFWNRHGDDNLGDFLRIGMIGATTLISNPFNPDVIDWLMRLDIYELDIWQDCLDLDDLLVAAGKLDSVYGVVQ